MAGCPSKPGMNEEEKNHFLSSSVLFPTLVEATLIVTSQCAFKVGACLQLCDSLLLLLPFKGPLWKKSKKKTKTKMHTEQSNETEPLASQCAGDQGLVTLRGCHVVQMGLSELSALDLWAKSQLIIMSSSPLFSITPCDYVSLRNP